ncbi:hypothetical protein HELRODRAFT_180348 [Helobdella robusta]|uniref:Uncharacterized protein n=1 Tax=Helobdella robusta TaxID=6412 RepID=T1FFS7_HELRO|nr:hypothetical protein HELRODRAFT_180348 [Helobdella robusta]ESN93939.1 hypothetical protein HELRODRAFT_180348 [Helobdella robusta]
MFLPNDDPIAILPLFKKTASTDWFENSEMQFQLRNVICKTKRFYHVIIFLPLNVVSNLSYYDALKAELLSTFKQTKPEQFLQQNAEQNDTIPSANSHMNNSLLPVLSLPFPVQQQQQQDHHKKRKAEHSSSSLHLILEIVCSWTDGCIRGQNKIRTSNQSGNCVISNNVITNNTINISRNKINISHSRTVNHIISDKGISF